MRNISCQELQLWYELKKTFSIIDIRESWEREICSLPGSKWIKMEEVFRNPDVIPPDEKVVIYCHHGIRSSYLIHFLNEKSQHNELYNLSGGIDRWAIEIDRKMPRY